MKIKKEMIIGIVILVAGAFLVGGAKIYQQIKIKNDLALRISSMGGTPQSIEGLKQAIAAYEKQIEAHVKDAAQTGVYWKILAIRLQDNGLYNEALEALERALYYNPVDATLHYLTGLSAATVAKSYHNFSGRDNQERERLFALAEESYLRAIELDDRYLRPRYGLGILYVFEFDRPAEAIPHLERSLEISRNDVDTLFVLARAYYMTSAYQKALDIYNQIISVTKDEQKKTEAQNNRQYIMGLLYG